jgi:hypothetical protein
MENFLQKPSKIRLLICSDVDNISACKLSEKFVPLPPYYDGIIIVGPFSHEPYERKEDEAVALGDIATMLAQFENIVCRVVYLPAETDPLPMIVNQMNLTPNSIGIHGRRLNLAPELYIMGFTEKGDMSNGVDSAHTALPHYEEVENIEIVSGTSLQIMKEMLANRIEQDPHNPHPIPQPSPTEVSTETGIFVLNYRYAHTLNQFLFHMNDELEQAAIDLCIFSSSTPSTDLTRLPKKFGKLSIVVTKSLRKGGYYTTVELQKNSEAEGGGGKWTTTLIEHHQL